MKEKRTAGDWIEIEHPPGAYAYIAAKFIDVGEATRRPARETPEAKSTDVSETEEPTEIAEAKPTESTPEAKPVAEEVTETKEWRQPSPDSGVTGAKGETEKTTEPGACRSRRSRKSCSCRCRWHRGQRHAKTADGQPGGC
ncbi:MAG: hypothetical protein Ct9H300mP32_3810 [Verrucomicrobiota bacterium]|nr:MAG: hypothetical protein Ct9H300mP32_3810 [Verrucomicrobiota bacterium]